jgi:N-acetylmuramoyl-L-alanine amidase
MKILVLTAGHGGSDQGAVSPDGRWIEAREALRLRDAIAARLRATGMPVVTDGSPGENAPLRDALRLLRRAGLLAVEIHFNAALSAAATGVEALALVAQAEKARRLAAVTAKTLSLTLRGDGGWKPDNAGQHHRLAYARAGGIVLETAFITNPEDMASYARQFVPLADALALLLTQITQE